MRINQGLRLLDPMKIHHKNCIAINIGNTLEHERAKFDTAFELIKAGMTIVTEAVFLNKCRADIYVPESQSVYEILASESVENAYNKTGKYPVPRENIHLIKLVKT